jgi:hypothetical protein
MIAIQSPKHCKAYVQQRRVSTISRMFRRKILQKTFYLISGPELQIQRKCLLKCGFQDISVVFSSVRTLLAESFSLKVECYQPLGSICFHVRNGSR